MLHLADLSNTARPAPLFHQWAELLQHEFHAQGRREELLGMPVTPMCVGPDPSLPEKEGVLEAAKALARQQLGFVTMFVLPMLEKMTEAGVAPRTVTIFRKRVVGNVDYRTARKEMKMMPEKK